MADEPGTNDDRSQLLTETRERLTRLEAETHRLRAQLSRLEADGEEQAAEALEAQLAEINRERTALGGSAVVAAPSPASAAPSNDAINGAPTAEPSAVPAASEAAPTEEPSGVLFDLNAKKPSKKPAHKKTAQKKTAQKKTDKRPAEAIVDEVHEAPVIEKTDEEEEENRKKPFAAQLRNAPAWATSLGVHAVILILFSLWTFVAFQDPPHELFAGPPDGSDEFFDEFSEIDLTPVELETTELEEFELEPTEISEMELTEIEEPWESAATGLADFTPGLASSLPTDSAALMLGEQGGVPDAGSGRGNQPDGGGQGGARFFGARSKGNRFAFVVDNSGSMKEGRMETTLMELQKAVFALSPKQEFYVIFFSDQAYPMFFPQSVDEMAPATRDNKQKLAAWLPTVETAVGGRIVDAMEMAAEVEPSVVYLLSDGDISSDWVMEKLTEKNEWEFTIHTLGMTVRNADHANKLLAIAQAHGGGFTPVGINPAAAQMAQQRRIPYHNKGPGPVWGSKVRAR